MTSAAPLVTTAKPTPLKVVIPYKPRPLQRAIHNETARFNVVVCHRRFGKTVFAINGLIKLALTCPLKRPRVAYMCPFYSQAKRVAWDYVKEFCAKIPAVKFNEGELRVDFPNGARLTLYGADNPDSLRGIYLDGVVLDEFAQMPPRVWSEILRPALADRQGRAVFIGTPQGKNKFWEIYERARNPENTNWAAYLYRASETGILLPEEIEDMREELSPEEFEQELECSWVAAIRGAFYGKQMAELEKTGKITNVPHDPALPVYTSWDLGIRDSTVIWFWQQAGAEVRAIECLAFQGTGLPEMIKELRTRPYNYAEHIAPHDIQVRELGSGKSRLETARELGLDFTVAPKLSVMDGIDATRSMLPRCWFDYEKCKDGIDALTQYRTEWDDKRQIFRNNPLHDWCSDYADSVRYFAVKRPTVGGGYSSYQGGAINYGNSGAGIV